jgi:hypothetical protein
MTLSASPEQTLREPIAKGFKPSPILYDDGRAPAWTAR